MMINSDLPILSLKPGREKSLLRKHPWIFSGAVAGVSCEPKPGDTIRVDSADGRFMGWGAYSPYSQIRARIWSFEESEIVNETFFRNRLINAIHVRALTGLLPGPGKTSAAVRLVHGESDGLPGFVLDQYSDTLVMQALSTGAERWRETVADLALEYTGAVRVFERSDAEVRQLENLPLRIASVRGDDPPDRIPIIENGLTYQCGCKPWPEDRFLPRPTCEPTASR